MYIARDRAEEEAVFMKDRSVFKDFREEYAEEQQIKQQGLDINYRAKQEKYDKQLTTYESNKSEAFTVMLKHCSQTMKNRIKELHKQERKASKEGTRGERARTSG